MNRRYTLFAALILLALSCKKDEANSCFKDRATIESITDRQCTVKASGSRGVYYLIPQGAIDTRYLPCTLAQEFAVENLQVFVTGEVKQTVQIGSCCTYDLDVSAIHR